MGDFEKILFLRFAMGLFSPTHTFSGGFWQISLKRSVYVKNWRKQTAFFSILGLDESQRRNYCRRSIGKLLGIMVPGYFVLTNMRISFTYSHCLKMFHVSLYIAVNCTVTITLRAGEGYFEMKLVIRFWPTSAYSPLHYFVLCFLRCLFKVPDCVHE